MKKNKAVKNNPDKFPEGYILKLDDQEVTDLRSKILISSWGGRRNAPTVFTKLKKERNNIKLKQIANNIINLKIVTSIYYGNIRNDNR